MDSRIIAALIIGAILGAVAVMMWACLAMDRDIRGEVKNEDYHTGGTEGEAATEVQQKDRGDIHAE